MLELIVAVSLNGAIGKDGKLPWYIPDELRLFKQITMGKTVIMGRKTWDSLPVKPLPGRKCVVLSRTHVDTDIPVYENTVFVDSIEGALAQIRPGENGIIIGGEQIYRKFLPRVDVMHISTVLVNINEPNTKFPPYNPDEWVEVSEIKNRHFTYRSYYRL